MPSAIHYLVMQRELLELMKVAASTPFARSQFSTVIKNITAPPLKVRGRPLLARSHIPATVPGIANVEQHIANLQNKFPDVWSALKKHPMAQHMNDSALTQNFMMSHKGGDIRDTARSLGVLGQPSHADILRQANAVNLGNHPPAGAGAGTFVPAYKARP